MMSIAPREAWRLAYQFIRADGDQPWSEIMRPYKAAAIAANKLRLGTGRDRWDLQGPYLHGRSAQRRADLPYLRSASAPAMEDRIP